MPGYILKEARSLAIKDAQIIAHPANIVLPNCPDAMVTRRLENRVFTATADWIGEENRGRFDLKFIGRSEIIAPDGTILCRLGVHEPSISFADVDHSLSNTKQVTENNHLFNGLRLDQYDL